MYLGFLLSLVAWAAFLGNALAFALIPAFVVYMNLFQIRPEERALATRFEPVFEAYKSKVRRWL
jgi:protein-S-isoprenylcysteine O-methyltransferase Ste14